MERSLERARRESTEARASNSALKRERDEFAGGCVELEASVEVGETENENTYAD